MIIRELITRFGFNVDDAKLKKMGDSVEKIKKNLDKASQKAKSIGGDLTLKVTLPVLAMGTAFVKSASDAEEAESKFATVFSDMEDMANEMATSLAKSYGLSSKASKELLGDTGDLLTGFGFSQKMALELSNEVQKLAVDLASFTNFSGGATGASKALSKALLGERESIKSLGIAILEEDVKARVLLNTQKGLTFETERQAKAYATLQMAQEQSKNAIGDFSRTSGQFANQWRIMKSRLEDAAVSFGKRLIPAVNAATKVVTRFFTWLENLGDGTKDLILIIAALAATIGPLLFLIGSGIGLVSLFATGFIGLAGALKLTNIQLAIMLGKAALIGAVIGGALIGLFLIIDDLLAFARGGDSLFGSFVEEIKKVGKAWTDVWEDASRTTRMIIAAMLTPIRFILGLITTVGNALGALAAGEFGEAFKELGKFSSNVSMDAGMNGGIGGLLGFGPDAGTAADQRQADRFESVQAEATVNVTLNGAYSEEQVEEASERVRSGVNFGLSDMIKDARRNMTTPVAE